MKRFVLLLPLALTLAGCAQLFDTNLYGTIDNPPPLKASDLAGKSVADIQSQISDPNGADAFYEQLQGDPAALDAVQGALADDFNPAAVAAATTPAAKEAVVEAAQTYILVTANGSEAASVVQDAILQASNLISGGDPETAISNLFDGKTTDEISTILTNFLEISSALDAMQDASTSGTSVDSDLFFGGSTATGELAQTALVAAAVSALVTDAAGGSTAAKVAALAAQLAAGTAPTTGTAMADLTDALEGTDTNPSTNNYAYLAAVTGALGL